MKKIVRGGWIYYLEEGAVDIDERKCGKWMYFFYDKQFVDNICVKAVETGVVTQSKYSDENKGVSCFYLNGDDIESHKRVIKFFLDNNLIRKTKAGKLFNISFKFDDQTRDGEYGDEFESEIKLERFINLNTGEWII